MSGRPDKTKKRKNHNFRRLRLGETKAGSPWFRGFCLKADVFFREDFMPGDNFIAIFLK